MKLLSMRIQSPQLIKHLRTIYKSSLPAIKIIIMELAPGWKFIMTTEKCRSVKTLHAEDTFLQLKQKPFLV